MGGGIPTSHSSIYHVRSVLCTSMVFAFCLVLVLLSRKHKNTKNIFVVSLGLFLCFFALVCLKRKIQKYFAFFGLLCFCVVFLCLLVSKKLKTPKIFVVLLWFCEFFAGFSRL